MSTTEGADEFAVLGYTLCRCGEWLIDPGDSSSIRLCPGCRAKLANKAQEGRLRYEAHGRTFTTKQRPKRKPKKRQKAPLTVKQKDDRRRLDRARMRTYVRLARVYRAMYELILAEEKLREGLDPTVGSAIPRPRAIEAELLRDLAEAEQRESGARLHAGG